MKNVIKVFGIIALFAIVGLGMTACGNIEEPPAAPYISGSYTSTSSTIVWSPVSGANTYTIYCTYTSNYTTYNYDASRFSYLATTSSTSYTHYTSSKYAYTVTASNGAGTSGFSNVVYVP